MKLKPIKAQGVEHALLSPSAAKKWLGCPASLACEVGTPNESGAAAVNGTAMHFMAESVLRVIKEGGYGPDFGVNTWFKVSENCEATVICNYGKGPIGMSDNGHPGNVPVTEDFVTQVTKYVNYCAPIMAAAELAEIEAKVSLTRLLHPGFELKGEKLETFGTADFVALLRNHDAGGVFDGYTLIVGDLKTGRHKVHAAENKQMMLYALGLLRKYSRTYEISAVKMFIFQPYAGGADEWGTSPTALEQFGKFASKRALMALDAYQRGKKGLKAADFRPSGDACQWCKFAEPCDAKRRAVSSEVEADLSDGIEMTPAQLKAEWDKLPLMRKHIDDIEKAMYASLMRGDKVEGLKLVEGREGNRSWTDPKLVIAKFGDRVMVESIMTPTAALKAIPESELAEFIVRKPGQPSIATADDKRPAWSPVTDEDLS